MLDIWQLLFKKTTILYRQNHPFGSENGAGIYFFRFTMQCCQVLVTGRIMADNEAFDTGFQSDVAACRAVEWNVSLARALSHSAKVAS